MSREAVVPVIRNRVTNSLERSLERSDPYRPFQEHDLHNITHREFPVQEGLEDQRTVIKTLQAKLKVSAVSTGPPYRLVLDWSVIVVDRVDVIDVS